MTGISPCRTKKSFRPDEQNRPDVARRRQGFAHEQKRLDPERLVFLDETGVHRAMRKTQAWAPSGQRAVSYRPGAKRKNVSVMGAVRRSGIVAMKSSPKAMTIMIFLGFLQTCLLPRLRPGDILVMDNLAAHRSPRVKRLLKAHQIGCLFTPAYSPEFNPIEMVWNSLKRRFERKLGTWRSSLGRAIAAAWRSLKHLRIDKLMVACGHKRIISTKTI